MQVPHFYAVYRFPKGEKIDIQNTDYLVKLVDTPRFLIEKSKEKRSKWVYVVTAIDRCWNESSPSAPVNVIR